MSEYQKLLDDNFDIFEYLASNNEDFLDLVCSIRVNNEEDTVDLSKINETSVSAKSKSEDNVIKNKESLLPNSETQLTTNHRTLDNLSTNTSITESSVISKQINENIVTQDFPSGIESSLIAIRNVVGRDGCSGGSLPSSLSQQTNVSNYQKLLDDDADLFENLSLSKNDEFLDMLCSIRQGEKKTNTTLLLENDKKYEFKYVVEKHKNQHDTENRFAEFSLANSTNIPKSSTNIVNSENGYPRRKFSSSIFPDLEQSNKQESPIKNTTVELIKLLGAIQQDDEEPKQENKFKYLLVKSKSDEHNANKENEGKHIDHNTNSSHFSQETNVSDYQKLLDDEQFVETLHTYDESNINLHGLYKQSKEYEFKLSQEDQSKPVYEKQKNVIQDNNNLHNNCFLNFEVPEDTENTIKFVPEINKDNANILEKQVNSQVSNFSNRSVFNLRNKQQNINDDFQNYIDLTEQDFGKFLNPLSNSSQICELARNYPKSNQDQLKCDYVFKNKKMRHQKYTNVSNSECLNYSSITSNSFSDFLHNPNQNIDKLERNSCHSLTNTNLSLNTIQTKQFLLQNSSGSLESNVENICKLKNRKGVNVLRKERVKLQANKHKTNMEVEFPLRNSIKEFYGVSKSKQKPKMRSKSTPISEQPRIFGQDIKKYHFFAKHNKNDHECNYNRSPGVLALNREGVKWAYTKQIKGTSRQEKKLKSKLSEEVSRPTNIDIDNKEICSKQPRTSQASSNKSFNNTQTTEFSLFQRRSVSQSLSSINLDINRNIRIVEKNTDNGMQKSNNSTQRDFNFSNNSNTCSEVFQLPIEYLTNSQQSLRYRSNSNNCKQIKQSNGILRQKLEKDLSNICHCNSQLSTTSQDTFRTPDMENISKKVCSKHSQDLREYSDSALRNTQTVNFSSFHGGSVVGKSFLNEEQSVEKNIQKCNNFIPHDTNTPTNSLRYNANAANIHSEAFQLPMEYLKEDKLHSQSLRISQDILGTPIDSANKEFCQNLRRSTNSSLSKTKTLAFGSHTQGGSTCKSFANCDDFNRENIGISDIENCNNLVQHDTQKTDLSNIFSEDFQATGEYLNNNREELNNYVRSNCLTQYFCEGDKNDKTNIYRTTNKIKSRIVKKNKQNVRSSRSQNTLISNYYKAKKFLVEKPQVQSITKDKDNTEYVATQVLVDCLNFECDKGSNCKDDQECNNTETNNVDLDLLKANYTIRNINNANPKDTDNKTRDAKANATPDYINAENVLDLPHYLFSSHASTFASKDHDTNDTELSNSNTFNGDNAETTHTTFYENTSSHILKETILPEISNSNNKDAVATTQITYHIKYLKDFIEVKLRNIRDYLCRCQMESNKDDDGSYIDKIILNSLNNASEDALLNELQSQDLFSQSLTFTPVLVEYANMKFSQSERKSDNKFSTPPDQDLVQAIDHLSRNKSLVCQTAYDVPVPDLIKKMFILQKVSDIFTKLLNDVENDRVPVIQIRNQKNWQNCYMNNNNFLVLKPVGQAKNVRIKLNTRQVTSKFNLIIYIMGRITDLLINNRSCTKRELYYQIVKFVKHQGRVNNAVDSVSCLLDEPPWDFGIFATNKGLVYGDLTVVLSENEVISCNIHGVLTSQVLALSNINLIGSLIPQNQSKITKLVSNASFILVVEKDSIFQKLLDDDLPNALPRTFIMITGKGFADINTRLFIKKLWHVLNIPVLALVDADPYGIEIMLTYRFGSLALSHLSEYLALPSLRWIGIHPKEIIALGISYQPLTARDTQKIQELLQRPYINSVPKIKLELETMAAKNFKAEIEGAMKSDHYLKNFYIPHKLYAKDYF